MKRLIGIIISALVMLIATVSVNAAGMEIEVGNANANAGDTVNIAVSVKNNTGMAIGNMKIVFDNTKIVPVSVTKKDILNGCMYFTSNLDDENIDAAELGELTFSWMNVTNLNGDGDIANIEFMIKDNVTESIPIKLEISELADYTQKDITASTKDGVINIGSTAGNVDSSSCSVEVLSTTITKGSDKISGILKLSAYLPKADNLTFVCAVYDNSGKLIAAKTVEKNLTEGINEVEFPQINAPVTGIGKYAVKVYSWNSLSGMKPVADSILQTY